MFDSDLMKYCYILKLLKQNLAIVREVTFCTALHECVNSGELNT